MRVFGDPDVNKVWVYYHRDQILVQLEIIERIDVGQQEMRVILDNTTSWKVHPEESLVKKKYPVEVWIGTSLEVIREDFYKEKVLPVFKELWEPSVSQDTIKEGDYLFDVVQWIPVTWSPGIELLVKKYRYMYKTSIELSLKESLKIMNKLMERYENLQ